MKKLKELFEIFFTFAKVGAFTFGGGIAMLPMLQKELIEKRGWMTEEDLIDYYAIGQSTPGIIAVNVSTFVGFRRLGIIGGIFGTLGMVTPSVIIISILATVINSIDELPLVQKALKGVNVAVAALLTKVIFDFAKKVIWDKEKKKIKNLWGIVLMLLSFTVIFFFKAPSWSVILGTIIIGIINSLFAMKKNARAKLETSENTEASE